MDLNGNYDQNFKMIQWGNKAVKIMIANPYIVAYLQNNQIEVRNIFNPLRIFQKIELDTCMFVSLCVAQNLLKKHQGRLDDFYVIIKNQLMGTTGSAPQDMFTMIKFKQERAELQLSLWYELKLYSTSLKFIDFL